MTEQEKQELIEWYKREWLEYDVDLSINIGLPLDDLWHVAEVSIATLEGKQRNFHTPIAFKQEPSETVKAIAPTFEGKTELFFVLLKEMLRRGHLKLQRDDKLIEHTPEEWEQIFRAAFPRKVNGIWIGKDVDAFIGGFFEDDIGIWLTVNAPAFAVWVDPDDGSLYWSS